MKRILYVLGLIFMSLVLFSCKETVNVTVTFDANTGQLVGETSVEIESGGQITNDMLPTVTKEGHTFKGWFLSAEASGEVVTFPYTVTEDVALYAGFEQDEVEPVMFVVTFNLNGGTTTGATTVEIEEGKQLNANQAPVTTKEGHTFKGWFLDAALANQVTFPLTINAATTIYAKWEKDAPVIVYHEVTFEIDGAVATGETTLQIEDGESLLEANLPLLEKEGFIFEGWFLDASFEEALVLPLVITSATTIYAKWEEIPVIIRVTFDENTGELVSGDKAVIIMRGETIESAPEVTKRKHILLGWNTKADGTGEDVTFPFTPTIDVDLFAKWEQIPLTFHAITLVPNGGTLVGDTVVQAEQDEPMAAPQISYEGHSFYAWFSDEAYTQPVTFPYYPTAPATFYAKWKAAGNPVEERTFKYVYEAETRGTANMDSAQVETAATASGGESLGYLTTAGMEVSFTVNAEAATAAIIEFVMSSSSFNYSNWRVEDQIINMTKMEIKVNGVVIPFWQQTIKGSNQQMVFNSIWTPLFADPINLVEGENTITIKSLNGEFPNFDYLGIYTDSVVVDGVGKEIIPDRTYEGNIEAQLFVGAYPAGAAYNKAIIKFANPVKQLTADQLNLIRVNGTGAYTNTKAFLSDAAGVEIADETSQYVTLELQVVGSEWGIGGNNNVFSYNSQTGRNTWKDLSTFTISLGGHLEIGEVKYNKVDNTKVTMTKVVPVLDGWDLTGTHTYVDPTHGNVTLLYASYAPTAAAGGVKNPLIVWLHGAGEGGLDPSITLLGNEVTALTHEPIQNLFVSGEEKGAYILSVQSPTMWMNDGSGNYGSTSMYQEALWATIKQYVNGNPDIDTNRIYIGGCSNGGFMTMAMMISDSEKYFAAAFPVCQAYPYANITAEQKEALKSRAIWFVQSNDDTTVQPATTSNLYVDLINLGATNVYYSLFENVTYDGVKFAGHYSWIYALRNEVKYIQPTAGAEGALTLAELNPASTATHPTYASLMAWLAAQVKA